MSSLINTRASIITFYKKYEIAILFILKFIIGVTIFTVINSIGLHNKSIDNILKPPVMFASNMILGLLFAVLPATLSYVLMILTITLAFSSSIEVSIIICLLLLCILFLYARLSSKESLLIIAMIFAFYFNIPYLVPILAGLYFGLSAIIPVMIGTAIWNITPLVKILATENTEMPKELLDFVAYPKNIMSVYHSILNSLNETNQLIAQIFIFSLVIIIIFVIKQFSINYSKEIAIVLGGFINIVGFLIFSVFVDFSSGMFSIIFMTVISVILALIVKSFDVLVDYKCAERLEFEDEEFYYYVRVIPKIKTDTKKTTDSSLVSTLSKDKDGNNLDKLK